MELKDEDSSAFDDVLTFLENHPDFEKWKLKEEPVLSLPGLQIYPDRRKVYADQQEIHLTAKEYDLLCLLAANKGRVLTYAQIYEKIWGEDSLGSESGAISYHVCNLRKKLQEASPQIPFPIRCIREVGYSFSTDSE